MSGRESPMQEFVNDIGVFHEGLAVVNRDGEWFHILESGEPAYPERHASAEYYQNGLAWVMGENGEWKVIDKQGREVECAHALPFNRR